MASPTTLASAIITKFSQMAETLDYQDTPIQREIAEIPNPGGSAYTFPIHYGANSSTSSFTVGSTYPAAGNELFATGSISYDGCHKVTRYNLDKIAIDYLRNANNFDGIAAEMDGAMKAHLYGVEAGLVVDLEGSIDKDGNYGGLDRATYKMASYEAAVSTLALSDLQLMVETLRKVPIGANWNSMALFSTIDMINEYRDLQGVAYREMNYQIGSGLPFDLGKEQLVPAYSGRPWIEVPTMTASVVLAMDPSKVKRVRVRPIEITPLAVTEDRLEFAITSAQRLVVLDPRRCGKLT